MTDAQEAVDRLTTAGVPPREVARVIRWAQREAVRRPESFMDLIGAVVRAANCDVSWAMQRETWWRSIRGTRGTLAAFEAHLARRCAEASR